MAELPRRARRGVVAGAVIGLLLLQSAWILTLPPFRGLDEHDHAYKTAAVARGDLSGTHTASPQRHGQFVVVPRDLVEAARPVCEQLTYTTEDNCRGHATSRPGLVRVASSAAPYNPAYYVLPGLASRWFSGATALYVMRVTSALMCTLLLGLAVVALRRWARTPWPGVGVLMALSPTLLYSTSIAAPNGLEMAAALLVWCALLGVVRQPRTARADPVLVALGIVGAVLLAVVRGLGPLWLLLIVAAVIMLQPLRLGTLVRDRGIRLAAVAAVAATGFATWWTMSAHAVSAPAALTEFPDSPWPKLPVQWILWFLQSLAAFPARDEAAPIAVYAIGLTAWAVFVGCALARANMRHRLAVLFVAAAVTVVAVATTLNVYSRIGTAWQGRYGYPLTLGVLLIAGCAIERRASGAWQESRWPAALTGAALAAMLVLSQAHVLSHELAHSAIATSPEWLRPSVPLLVLLDLVGVGLLTWALSEPPGHRTTVASRPPSEAAGNLTR